MEVTPGVRPTGHLHQPAFGIGEKAVVSHIGIGLQISAIRFQKLFRPRTFSRRGVIEYRRRMFPIPNVRPESPLRVVRVNFRSSTFTGVSSVPTTFELSTNCFKRT